VGYDVPHPGPQPELFQFPFPEAHAACRAIEELIDELRALLRTHHQAVDVARVDFEGRTRREFDQAFDEVTSALDAQVTALGSQLDGLEADIRTAEARRDAALQARADWSRRLDAWQAAQRATSGPR
jgi:hypothetical protein